MFNRMYNYLLIIFVFFLPLPVFARCAVCYTNGLSGASIAVIVIVISFIALFFGNKLLQKILNKD